MALPESRSQTLNPGDTFPAALGNEIQDAIVQLNDEVNRRIWFFPFEGRTRAIGGSVAYSGSGALLSNVLFSGAAGIELYEHDTLVQCRFRVQDNGTDTWLCEVSRVDANDSETLLASTSSSGGGTWEWVALVLNHAVLTANRYRLRISTANGLGAPMLASGVEMTTS